VSSRYPSATPAVLGTVIVLLSLVLAGGLIALHLRSRPAPPAPPPDEAPVLIATLPTPAVARPTPTAPPGPPPIPFPGAPVGQSIEIRYLDGTRRTGVLDVVEGTQIWLRIPQGRIAVGREALHVFSRIQLFEDDFQRYLAARRIADAARTAPPAPFASPPPGAPAAGLDVRLLGIEEDQQQSFFGIAFAYRYRIRVHNPGPRVWEGRLALQGDTEGGVPIRLAPSATRELVLESAIPGRPGQPVDLMLLPQGSQATVPLRVRMI